MMHSAGEAGSSTVPAFLTKLCTLVEDPATDHHICWDPSGRSFHVYDQGQFAKEILPLYFKHSNIASFIRQLNMYGFRKVVGIEQGGLKTEKDDMQFVHQYFVRDQDYLLEHIKRKVPNVKSDEVKVKPDDVKWVLSDVRQMRGKQESMNSKLETLKRENEALWREVASLRQKHVKQQQIVNKLIQFLVTLVDNRGLRGGTKRKMAPMITEGESSDAKISKLGQPLSIDSSIVQSADSGSGLLIQDVTGQQLSPTLPTVVSRPSVTHQPSSPTQVAENTICIPLDTNTDLQTDLIMSSLQEGAANDLQSVLGQMEEVKPEEVKRNAAITDQALLATLSGESESAADKLLSGGATATVKPHPVLKRSLSRYDMSDHLDTMQADLESIKDLLTASPQYTFDPTSTLSLFGDQDLSGMVWGMDGSDNTQPSSSAVLGNELIEYTPQDHDLLSLFDLGGIENENEEEKNILEDTLGDLHTPVSAHVSDPMVKASEMAQISTNELD